MLGFVVEQLIQPIAFSLYLHVSNSAFATRFRPADVSVWPIPQQQPAGVLSKQDFICIPHDVVLIGAFIVILVFIKAAIKHLSWIDYLSSLEVVEKLRDFPRLENRLDFRHE